MKELGHIHVIPHIRTQQYSNSIHYSILNASYKTCRKYKKSWPKTINAQIIQAAKNRASNEHFHF